MSPEAEKLAKAWAAEFTAWRALRVAADRVAMEEHALRSMSAHLAMDGSTSSTSKEASRAFEAAERYRKSLLELLAALT